MPTVLVVDDTPVDRRLAGGLLEGLHGVRVEYAANGAEAVKRMEESRPDVVVTDLQMPELDGLELVTRIRLQYPQVPVIVMTARGSEAIAVQALERGAASYVPKSQLSEMLLYTVEDILALTGTERVYTELLRCQQRIEVQYALTNSPPLADALVDLIQQLIEGIGLTDHTGKFRIGVALRETLYNAIFRGNLELSAEDIENSREALLNPTATDTAGHRREQPPYRDRKVYVDVRITPEEARFVVRHEGLGSIGAEDTSGDLPASDRLHVKGGRGLVLMRSFMDEVLFNDAGNQVTLIKRRDPYSN